jgi:hypothetical protein
MASLSPHQRLLLDLQVDGELDAADQEMVEALLRDQPAAADWVHNVTLCRGLLQDHARQAAASVDFDALQARIAATTIGSTRDPGLEMLAMARFDGEALAPADADAVADYLTHQPQARGAVDGLLILRDLARLGIDAQADRVDQLQLSARIDQALDQVDAENEAARRTVRSTAVPARRPGQVVSLREWVVRLQAPLASLATAALLLVVLAPRLFAPASGDDGASNAAPATVVNHFYGVAPTAARALQPVAVVDSVDYESGHWAAVQPGDEDEDLAPVVWIAPLDSAGAPESIKPVPGTLESGQSL